MASKKVTLTIDGIDANEKKSSTKIQYVNPNVSDDVMRTFANKCAALSTDTHTATTKTTDEDITTAAPTKPKLTVTLDTGDGSAPRFYSDHDESVTDTGRRLLRLPTGMSNVPFSMKMDNQVASYFILQFCYSSINPGGVTAWWRWDDDGYYEAAVATIDFYFEETETTAATNYRMTISKDPATWEQI